MMVNPKGFWSMVDNAKKFPMAGPVKIHLLKVYNLKVLPT